MSTGVVSWWLLLCAVGALNILAWCASAVALNRRQIVMSAKAYHARRLQLLLSAVYVFGCAFRSAFPVFDVPRFCLHNSWLSSVIVGRSVATVAELCFVAQWALLLREASLASRSAVGRISSLAAVPLIALAETCSWYSVLTTSNLGHIAEESIWGLCAALMVTSMAVTWPRCTVTRHPALVACCIGGAAYVAFMLLVDVPMYWSRWIADESVGRHYMSIAQGVHDVASRWVVSYRWEDWKSEVVWMSLYFSVAVWVSIALIHAPVLRVFHPRDRKDGLPPRAPDNKWLLAQPPLQQIRLVTNTTALTAISSQFSPGPPRSTTRNVDLHSSAINE
jgi:hypothetical protein